MKTDKINFPAAFTPENSPIFVHNEIEIYASPQKVWELLVNATTWPEWYFNAADVVLFPQKESVLKADTAFKWKTFGNNLQSQVKEYLPLQRIAWLAKGTGIRAYHAWLIIPMPHGCKVITEETQHGWMCRLGKVLFPDRMYNYHQIWLQSLKEQCESGISS